LGLVLDIISINVTIRSYPASMPGMYPGVFDHLFDSYQGFPMTYLIHPINDSWSWIVPAQGGQFILFLIDLAFWILIAFIVLIFCRELKLGKAK
jgi:hypothetical protein